MKALSSNQMVAVTGGADEGTEFVDGFCAGVGVASVFVSLTGVGTAVVAGCAAWGAYRLTS